MPKLNLRVLAGLAQQQQGEAPFVHECPLGTLGRLVRVEPDHPMRMVCPGQVAVTCVSGTAWITIAGDVRDIVLEPGQRHVAAGRARLFINGMPHCVLRIESLASL